MRNNNKRKRISARVLVASLVLTTVGTGSFSSYAEGLSVETSLATKNFDFKNENNQFEITNDSLNSTIKNFEAFEKDYNKIEIATPSNALDNTELEDKDSEDNKPETSTPSNAPNNTTDGTDNKEDSTDNKEDGTDIEIDVAIKVGDTDYESFADALKEFKTGTFVLQRDVIENVIIPADAEIEIDLNGYTLTNDKSHTIINSGTLVITNTNKEFKGVVDNITDQKAAIYNEAGGNVAIEENCLITRSKETGLGFSIKGDNSYNTIINQGSLTIEDGASVTQGPKGGGYSHLISNGWRSDDAAASVSDNTASIIINGGKLSGGLTNIENYHLGEIYVYDGTFEDAEYNSICNYNIAEIEGGSFSIRVGTNGSVIYNRQRNDDTAIGKMSISGGSFKGNLQNVAGSLEVTGGTFTNKVASELIPYGYTCKRTDDGKFIVTEGQSSEEASMSIGGNVSDIISAGASKKETETVKLVVSDILSNKTVTDSKVLGLNSAFNLNKFLNSSEGSIFNNSGSGVELNLKVSITKIGLKEQAGTTNLVPASVKYEVYPTVKGRDSNGETKFVSLQSDNSQFMSGENIQFKLPVPSNVTEKYAKITHESDGFKNEVSYSKILGNGTEKYTTVGCSHFSTFTLEFIDSIPSESSGNNSGNYSDDSSDSVSERVININRGTWQQDERGWWFKRTDNTWPKSEWLECVWNGILNWYHFNPDGYLESGWFTDVDGQKYFLHDLHDGRFGYMYTGWNQINGIWYYFNTITKDGKSKGSLFVNGTTPDGYKVDKDGAWIQ